MRPATFFKTLDSAVPGSKELIDIMALEHHDEHNRYGGGANDHTVMYINWAIICLKLLCLPVENRHHNFPKDPRDASETHGRFLGYTYEDWNRAMALVKWNTKGSDRAPSGKRAISAIKNIATVPTFLTDEDLLKMVDEGEQDEEETDEGDTPELKARKNTRRFDRLKAEFEEACRDPDLPPEVKTALKMDAMTVKSKAFRRNLDVLEKCLTKTFLSGKRSERPSISKGDGLKFMEEQGKNAKVLWGVDDIEKKRMEAVNRFSRSALNLADVIMASTAADMPVEGLDDDEFQSRKAALAWTLRQQMGSQSVPLPSFKEACEWGKFDPEDLTIKEAPKPTKEGAEPLKYKPHQIPSKY